MALALQFMNRGKEVQRLEKVGKEFNEFVEDAGRKRWAEPLLNFSLYSSSRSPSLLRGEWRDWTLDQRATKVARGLQWAFTEVGNSQSHS